MLFQEHLLALATDVNSFIWRCICGASSVLTESPSIAGIQAFKEPVVGGGGTGSSANKEDVVKESDNE